MSDNHKLLEPILSKLYNAIWCHSATMNKPFKHPFRTKPVTNMVTPLAANDQAAWPAEIIFMKKYTITTKMFHQLMYIFDDRSQPFYNARRNIKYRENMAAILQKKFSI